MDSLVKKQYHSELKRIDWDFTSENGSAGFAGFHWYPARYVPQLAGTLINYFSEPGDVVLDPFCGSGTTLVEAFKFGRLGVGIDLNPIAVIMTKAKLIPFNESSFSSFSDLIVKEARSLVIESQGMLLSSQKVELNIPNYKENSDWYDSKTLSELGALWQTIHRHAKSKYFNAALVAFSAILRTCCSQEKHWGWICDNVKPTNFIYKDAIKKMSEKLAEFKVSAKQLEEEAADLQEEKVSLSEFDVYPGDCTEVFSKELQNRRFDLIVTSPPYLNMTDYINSQRLSFLWFQHDTESLRVKEIGARYKRKRKKPLDEYLKEMKKSFSAISQALKQDRFCCVVIGESPKHKAYLEEFDAICVEVGLELCESLSRRIGQKRSLWPILDKERILIFRKV